MTRKTLWLALLIGWVYIIYEYALRVSDSVIITPLMHDLHVSAVGIGLISTSYYIPYVLAQAPCGVLLDRFGTLRCWSLGIYTIAMGCFLFADSVNLHTAMFARILMGFGSAFAWIGVLKIVDQLSHHKNQAFLIGISMTIAMLGAIIGQAPWSHLVTQMHSWHRPYIFVGFLGLLLSLGIYSLHRRSVSNTHQKDSDAATFFDIVIAIKTLFSSSFFWCLGLYIAVLTAHQVGFSALWAIKFISDTHHLDRTLAASLLSFVWIGGMCGGPIIGWFGDRIKNKYFYLVAIGTATALLMLIVVNVPIQHDAIIASLLFLIGGLSNANVMVFTMICQRFYQLPTASILGVANTFNMSGGVVFQLLIGWILSHYAEGTHFSFVGYEIALSIIPLSLLMASSAVYWLGKKEFPKAKTLVYS